VAAVRQAGKRENLGAVRLRELLDHTGVEQRCVLRSSVGFLALHGGSQDRGTDVIAERAAERAGASYYGIVQPPSRRVHLPSKEHDPAEAPGLQRFLDHVAVAISVHGFGRDSFTFALDPERGLVLEPYGPPMRGAQRGPLRGIILGGRNEELLEHARTFFDDRFEGYHVADRRVRLGFHPRNPANPPRRHGIQVELPPGLRGIGPLGERPLPDEDDPLLVEVTDALVELAAWAAANVAINGSPGPPTRTTG
jgi:phage replication-related protein YjqB (UPF0714/DUF867 family)